MPLTSGSAAVGTVATQLNTGSVNPSLLHVQNIDNTDTIYLGGPAVQVGFGAGVAKSAEHDFTLFPGQIMYAISSKAGHIVSWLHQTQ
jgi:hypothetical protein